MHVCITRFLRNSFLAFCDVFNFEIKSNLITLEYCSISLPTVIRNAHSVGVQISASIHMHFILPVISLFKFIQHLTFTHILPSSLGLQKFSITFQLIIDCMTTLHTYPSLMTFNATYVLHVQDNIYSNLDCSRI